MKKEQRIMLAEVAKEHYGFPFIVKGNGTSAQLNNDQDVYAFTEFGQDGIDYIAHKVGDESDYIGPTEEADASAPNIDIPDGADTDWEETSSADETSNVGHDMVNAQPDVLDRLNGIDKLKEQIRILTDKGKFDDVKAWLKSEFNADAVTDLPDAEIEKAIAQFDKQLLELEIAEELGTGVAEEDEEEEESGDEEALAMESEEEETLEEDEEEWSEAMGEEGDSDEIEGDPSTVKVEDEAGSAEWDAHQELAANVGTQEVQTAHRLNTTPRKLRAMYIKDECPSAVTVAIDINDWSTDRLKKYAVWLDNQLAAAAKGKKTSVSPKVLEGLEMNACDLINYTSTQDDLRKAFAAQSESKVPLKKPLADWPEVERIDYAKWLMKFMAMDRKAAFKALEPKTGRLSSKESNLKKTPAERATDAFHAAKNRKQILDNAQQWEKLLKPKTIAETRSRLRIFGELDNLSETKLSAYIQELAKAYDPEAIPKGANPDKAKHISKKVGVSGAVVDRIEDLEKMLNDLGVDFSDMRRDWARATKHPLYLAKEALENYEPGQAKSYTDWLLKEIKRLEALAERATKGIKDYNDKQRQKAKTKGHVITPSGKRKDIDVDSRKVGMLSGKPISTSRRELNKKRDAIITSIQNLEAKLEKGEYSFLKLRLRFRQTHSKGKALPNSLITWQTSTLTEYLHYLQDALVKDKFNWKEEEDGNGKSKKATKGKASVKQSAVTPSKQKGKTTAKNTKTKASSKTKQSKSTAQKTSQKKGKR